MLTLESVTKRFGGLTAVRDVTMEVRAGELLGIIGPNGAGKTTLFHLISGYYPPDEGRVVFDGRDITGHPAHAVSRLGLTRTFQIVKPFGNLSVLDNVMIGALTRLTAVRQARVDAERVLDTCGLTPHADARAKALPIGLRKRLESHPGALTLCYLALYSVGRFFIEGLRIDSLMLGPFRAAQIMSLLLFVGAVVGLVLVLTRRVDVPEQA